MRHVRKGQTGGYGLEEAHRRPPATADEATSRWSSFGYKQDVMERLLEEQYRLCGYSEIRADEEKLNYHIEHVENKSKNPSRTFEYANLAASALSSEDLRSIYESTDDDPLREGQPDVFGGHAPGKRAGVDMARFVSCHRPGCPGFFRYLSDGRIVPARDLSPEDRDRAAYTIDLLNLNSGFLIVQRRRWWDELDRAFEENHAAGLDLEALAGCDLLPYKDQSYSRLLSRFFTLTRQFYGPLAERVLAACPEIR